MNDNYISQDLLWNIIVYTMSAFLFYGLVVHKITSSEKIKANARSICTNMPSFGHWYYKLPNETDPEKCAENLATYYIKKRNIKRVLALAFSVFLVYYLITRRSIVDFLMYGFFGFMIISLSDVVIGGDVYL